jgi:steroid delta-isomerase-like uncharacterized protein
MLAGNHRRGDDRKMADDSQGRDDRKQVAVRFISEVQGQGKVELIDELVSDDFVHHGRMAPTDLTKAGLRDSFRAMQAAFADLQVEIHDVAVDGDKVWLYKTVSGVHVGDLLGRPPSNTLVAWDTVDIFTIKDGKIAEVRDVRDFSAVENAARDAQG